MTSETERVTFEYEVTNADNEYLRKGKVSGTFPTTMAYISIIDELEDRAYEKEQKKSWKDGYGIYEN